MKLAQLNRQQIEQVHKEHMVHDFPKPELKPLDMIYKALDKGCYECLGLFDEDNLIGYVYLVKKDNSYLVDYIATFPEIRNNGAGGQLLSLLDEYLSDADNIIGEVEDPDFTEDPDERNLQQRRLGFYKRNGCRDTGLRVTCFGVHFIIMETGSKTSTDLDSLWLLYSEFYRMVLPSHLYEKSIKRM